MFLICMITLPIQSKHKVNDANLWCGRSQYRRVTSEPTLSPVRVSKAPTHAPSLGFNRNFRMDEYTECIPEPNRQLETFYKKGLSLDRCKVNCFKDTKCKSFQFFKKRGRCITYHYRVKKVRSTDRSKPFAVCGKEEKPISRKPTMAPTSGPPTFEQCDITASLGHPISNLNQAKDSNGKDFYGYHADNLRVFKGGDKCDHDRRPSWCDYTVTNDGDSAHFWRIPKESQYYYGGYYNTLSKETIKFPLRPEDGFIMLEIEHWFDPAEESYTEPGYNFDNDYMFLPELTITNERRNNAVEDDFGNSSFRHYATKAVKPYVIVNGAASKNNNYVSKMVLRLECTGFCDCKVIYT
mmetsp:Transcript_19205/g.27022  ORF Transcript_19205/g.27022 Transcript_19205/m.27022 type:complete len:352 (+) Transcript_19205:502-1557(+)